MAGAGRQNILLGKRGGYFVWFFGFPRLLYPTLVFNPDFSIRVLMFIRQNNGTLSKRRRAKEFSDLTDDEVQRLETIIQDVFEGFDDTESPG